MTVRFDDETIQGPDGAVPENGSTVPASERRVSGVADGNGFSAVDLVLGLGESQKVGRFRFFLDGQRWEWSDPVARMHGYEPGEIEPTTDLLLQHKHPDDREHVTAVLDNVMQGKPFSSRHRVIDTAGRTRCVVVAGDRMLDGNGELIGMSGFYIDITDSLHSEITGVLSAVAGARARIEQAKGVLMAGYGITAERAFDILVWRSQETNLKLRDLADRFLNALSRTALAETQRQIDRALLTLE